MLRARRYSRTSGRSRPAAVARGGAEEAARALVAADSIRSAPVKFLYRGFAHSVAAPLRKKARSARLLGCKRPRNGSRSLPPFSGRWTGRGRVGRKAWLLRCLFGVGGKPSARGGGGRTRSVLKSAGPKAKPPARAFCLAGRGAALRAAPRPPNAAAPRRDAPTFLRARATAVGPTEGALTRGLAGVVGLRRPPGAVTIFPRPNDPSTNPFRFGFP